MVNLLKKFQMLKNKTVDNKEITESMYGNYLLMCSSLNIEPVKQDKLTFCEYHKVRETYMTFKK